jgi:hypothetical protein
MKNSHTYSIEVNILTVGVKPNQCFLCTNYVLTPQWQ